MDNLLTPAQAIQYLQEKGYPIQKDVAGRDALRRLDQRGYLHPRRTIIGRHRRYSIADLDQFVKRWLETTAEQQHDDTTTPPVL